MLSEIWYKIAHTSGARIYGVSLGLISLAITARLLGPEGRGQLATIVTWVSIVSMILSLSLGQVVLRRATSAKSVDWLRNSFSTILVFCGFSSFVGWVGLGFYWYSGGEVFGEIDPILLIVAFVLLPVSVWLHYGEHLLTAIDKVDVTNRYTVIGCTVAFVSMLIAVPVAGFGVLGAFLATALGQLVIAIGGIRFLIKQSGNLLWPPKKEFLGYIKDGTAIHVGAIGTFLFASTDIVMVNHYLGSEATGYYQLGAQMIAFLLIAPQAASTILYGETVKLGPDNTWGIQKVIILKVSLGMILMAGTLALSVGYWLPWFVGGSFLPAVEIIRWQMMTVVLMGFSILMASQWLTRGFFKRISAVAITTGILNIYANSQLIPVYGMKGAVWASLVAYSIVLVVNIGMAIWCECRWRKSGSSRNKKLSIP